MGSSSPIFGVNIKNLWDKPPPRYIQPWVIQKMCFFVESNFYWKKTASFQSEMFSGGRYYLFETSCLPCDQCSKSMLSGSKGNVRRSTKKRTSMISLGKEHVLAGKVGGVFLTCDRWPGLKPKMLLNEYSILICVYMRCKEKQQVHIPTHACTKDWT